MEGADPSGASNATGRNQASEQHEQGTSAHATGLGAFAMRYSRSARKIWDKVVVRVPKPEAMLDTGLAVNPPMTNERPTVLSAALAIIAGMIVWLMVALTSARREAWDDPLYWWAAYPVAIVLAALLGAAFPYRPWRWAWLSFQGQFIAMVLLSGHIGSLWLPGLVMFTVLALPAMAVAQLAGKVAQAIERSRASRS